MWLMSFPGGSDGKESACNAETWAQFLGQEHPLEKGMATHSSILSWRIPQRSLEGTAHGVVKSQTGLSN